MEKFSLLILIVLGFVIFSNGYLTYQAYNLEESTGKISTGEASICFNNPSFIDLSDCDSVMQQNTDYSCLVTATDEDDPTFTFSSEFVGEDDLFTITSWGLIDFYANQSFVGNHTVNITVDDNSGCENYSELYDFEVTNENDAPYLATNIPNQELIQEQTITFFLTDFFRDPDNDVMTFTKTITTNLIITITGNRVRITSVECDYAENVLFTAKDPYNLTADSNIVRIAVSCSSETGGSSTGTGGGGGGGGGSNSFNCEPQYACGSWESCAPDGRQRKKCVDMMDCEDVQISYVYRECKYVAHCYNELLDFDETGIDCGGNDCNPCPTCTDEIQNGDETGIDCGGNICEPCEHCTNGLMDYDEEDIDCGGNECVACPTCTDEIQNGDETGIDCGGSICEPCKTIQQPALVGSTTPWPAYAAAVMILLALLLLTYKFYRQKIKSFIARIRLLFAGKIPKELLLEKIDADNLIRELNLLIERYKQHGLLNQAIIFDLMSIGRSYYVKAFKVKSTVVYNELLPIIEKKRFTSNLTDILKGFFKKIEFIEKGEVKPRKEEFEQMAEEFKEIIYLTSPWQPRKGILHKIENLQDLVAEEKVYALLHNALFALEFGESSEALKIYVQILKEYDTLLMIEKEHVYPDLIRLYKEILYAKKVS